MASVERLLKNGDIEAVKRIIPDSKKILKEFADNLESFK
jgi:hypothetical protein